MKPRSRSTPIPSRPLDAHAGEKALRAQLLRLVAANDAQRYVALADSHRVDAGAGADADALAREGALQLAAHVLVFARQQARQQLDDGDRRTVGAVEGGGTPAAGAAAAAGAGGGGGGRAPPP